MPIDGWDFKFDLSGGAWQSGGSDFAFVPPPGSSDRLESWLFKLTTGGSPSKARTFFTTNQAYWRISRPYSPQFDINRQYTKNRNDYFKQKLTNDVLGSGGPFYDGNLPPNPPPEDHMQASYGMTWIELRMQLHDMFMDSSSDSNIIEKIKRKSHFHIPIRSGKLMDMIFKSMRIDRASFYNTNYFSIFNYEWPPDRPLNWTGKNVMHSPPDQGYGDWATYRVTEPIPQSRISIDHVTPYGNALYNLNDPRAKNRPQQNIKDIAIKEMQDYYDASMSNILIEAMI